MGGKAVWGARPGGMQLPQESGGCRVKQQEGKLVCALLYPGAFSHPSLHPLHLCFWELGDLRGTLALSWPRDPLGV